MYLVACASLRSLIMTAVVTGEGIIMFCKASLIELSSFSLDCVRQHLLCLYLIDFLARLIHCNVFQFTWSRVGRI